MDFHALNEKTQRGYQDFPIQFYAVTETHPRYEMPLHWHKEFELIRVLSGTFHLFLQNTEYVMGEGDVALVSSGALHRGTPDHCTYECIVFDLKMLGRYPGDKVSTKLSAIKNGEVSALGCYSAHSQDFCKIVHKLFDCLRAEAPYYEFTVYSLLYEIKEKYADKNVLLVCHNCVSRMVRSFFMNMSTEEYGAYHAPNAQLVEYEM